MTRWCCVAKEISERSQDNEDSVLRNHNRSVPIRILSLVGKLGFVAKLTVPKTSMMRANVAYCVEHSKPRFKHLVRQLVMLHDFPPHVMMYASEKGQGFSKAHDLNKHPEREGIMALAVPVPEMLNECFLAAIGFLLEFFNPAFVFFGSQPWQICRVGVPEGTVCVGEMIGKLGSDGNLDTFDGVHYQHSELSVEGVVVPYGIERCAGSDRVVRLAEGIDISAEAIVVYCFKTGNECITIRSEPAGDEEICLLLKGERGLIVFHCRLENEKPAELRILLKTSKRGAAGML